ncbi:MAG TPA: hypothetical protein VF872_06785, partial [Gaiellaceae bacterium]
MLDDLGIGGGNPTRCIDAIQEVIETRCAEEDLESGVSAPGRVDLRQPRRISMLCPFQARARDRQVLAVLPQRPLNAIQPLGRKVVGLDHLCKARVQL